MRARINRAGFGDYASAAERRLEKVRRMPYQNAEALSAAGYLIICGMAALTFWYNNHYLSRHPSSR